jgi:hypothetical protein
MFEGNGGLISGGMCGGGGGGGGAGKCAPKSTGSGAYKLVFQSGKLYYGKGLEPRMNYSIRRLESLHADKVIDFTFYPTETHTDAFIKEYQLMKESGGLPLNWDPSSLLYNKIWSPGKSILGE